MRIGEDFDKVEFEMFGLDLLEPNTFIGDILIFFLALYLGIRVSKLAAQSPFFTNWKRFFYLFSFAFLVGGFGHLMYNYWGITGKLFPWLMGVVGVFFIEQAMLNLLDNTNSKKWLIRISYAKMILALVGVMCVYFLVDLEKDYTVGMRIPSLNSAIGLIFSLGYLGYRYSKRITRSFNFFWMSVLTLVPAALFQSLKIDLHQWFDRNDFSHLLLMVGLLLYYKGIKGYAASLSESRATD